MNVVLQATDRLLVSVTADELLGISNALNEICHGIHIDDAEFQSRLGVSRKFLASVLGRLATGADSTITRTDSRIAAWSDGASVQSICITASGDPVDMNTAEATAFVEQLSEAIREAGT